MSVDLDKLHSLTILIRGGDTITCKKCGNSTKFGLTPVIGSVFNGPNKYTYTCPECESKRIICIIGIGLGIVVGLATLTFIFQKKK